MIWISARPGRGLPVSPGIRPQPDLPGFCPFAPLWGAWQMSKAVIRAPRLIVHGLRRPPLALALRLEQLQFLGPQLPVRVVLVGIPAAELADLVAAAVHRFSVLHP